MCPVVSHSRRRYLGVVSWPPNAEALVIRRSTHPEYNQRLQ